MDDPWTFTVLSTLTLLGSSAFIVLFAREPWRRTSFGRSLMAMAAGVWLFALVGTLRQWLGPDYPGRMELRHVAYAFIVYASWSRTAVLWHEQRKNR